MPICRWLGRIAAQLAARQLEEEPNEHLASGIIGKFSAHSPRLWRAHKCVKLLVVFVACCLLCFGGFFSFVCYRSEGFLPAGQRRENETLRQWRVLAGSRVVNNVIFTCKLPDADVQVLCLFPSEKGGTERRREKEENEENEGTSTRKEIEVMKKKIVNKLLKKKKKSDLKKAYRDHVRIQSKRKESVLAPKGSWALVTSALMSWHINAATTTAIVNYIT